MKEKERGLPAGWRERIKGKKVIFYNTSISGLLQKKEKHIQKMNRVFDEFCKNSKVVLWWRPHPLEYSTIQSMRVELKEYYQATRQRFIDENIGILDESMDAYRAIAISDAYYGDWSSLALLYEKTNKPVLMENDDVTDSGLSPQIHYLIKDFCLAGSKMWFVSVMNNLIFEMDTNTFKIENAIEIPGTMACEQYLMTAIYEQDNSLVLLPQRGKDIVTCHIAEGVFGRMDTAKISKTADYGASAQIKGEYFLFPMNGNRMIKYDNKSKRLYDKQVCEQENAMCSRACDVTEDGIYIVRNSSNVIYKYNPQADTLEDIKIGNENNRYWGIKKLNEFFILPHIDKNEVTLWNEESGETIKITDFPDAYSCIRGQAYSGIVRIGGTVCLFPSYANMILRIDLDNRKAVQCFPEVRYREDMKTLSQSLYTCVKETDRMIYAFAYYCQKWQVIDKQTGEMLQHEFSVSKEVEEKLQKRSMFAITGNDRNKSFRNTENATTFSLRKYIEDVSGYESESTQRKGRAETIGAEVYRTVSEA